MYLTIAYFSQLNLNFLGFLKHKYQLNSIVIFLNYCLQGNFLDFCWYLLCLHEVFSLIFASDFWRVMPFTFQLDIWISDFVRTFT